MNVLEYLLDTYPDADWNWKDLSHNPNIQWTLLKNILIKMELV